MPERQFRGQAESDIYELRMICIKLCEHMMHILEHNKMLSTWHIVYNKSKSTLFLVAKPALYMTMFVGPSVCLFQQ